jgi:hypothetical protein
LAFQQIKENIARWYVTNIIYPKIHDINSPGFVVAQLSRNGTRSFLREVFVPEQALAQAEKNIAALGAPGKAALYSAGKKFGYSFAESLHVPTLSTAPAKEVEEFTKTLLMFVGAMWARRSDEFIADASKKRFEAILKDFVVCSKNGVGAFLTEGGIAGIWARMTGDPTVEGVQLECEGRKARQCHVLCAPATQLRKQKIAFNTETRLQDSKTSENDYHAINAVKPTAYAKHSMKELIDAGFFQYEERVLEFNGERYFPCEASFAEKLEVEAARVPKASQALFQACREFGEKTGLKAGSEPAAFVTDYLSALGWGDVLVEEKKGKISVSARCYPWTPRTPQTTLAFFRGLASGLVSSAFARKTVYRNARTQLQDTTFSVTLC